MTEEQIRTAFIRATQMTMGADMRWAERSERGMDDASLKKAIAYELGEESGCYHLDGLATTGRAAGLRIWITNREDRGTVHVTKALEPTLQGAATIRMAREVYGIGLPDSEVVDRD